MKTVLFDTRAWCLNVFPKMADYFRLNEGKNINPVNVYHNSIDCKKHQRNGEFENLADYFTIGTGRYTKSEIALLEKKYNLINLWNVVYFDRYLKNKDEEYIIKQISYYLYAWEEIFKNYKPDFIINETVTGLWNYIPFALSKYYNCDYLGILFTKNTNRYFFSRDIFGSFPQMVQAFEKHKSQILYPAQKKEAQDFSNNFRNKHIVPSYMKFSSSLPKIHNFFNPYRITVNVYKDIKMMLQVRNDYKIDYRFQGYKRDFERLLRVMNMKIFKTFTLPDSSDKYILFPLHYQPEASTDVCAAYYVDQYNVILNLVRSLPFEYKLYVKEHYAVLGSKEMAFYKKIKKLPNVKLIDPWIKISDLINNAGAIAVLTGTTGLEGIILKKPVIVFGHVFFDIYPQIYRVNNLEELPGLINHALHDFRVDEDMYDKFILAYISSGYEGRMHGGGFENDEIALHCENLLKEIGTH